VLSENYRFSSTVRVDTDVVSVMTAYSDLVCLRVVHCAKKYWFLTINNFFYNLMILYFLVH